MIENRPSKIHGTGVFATKAIERGVLVINWNRGSEVTMESNPGDQVTVRLIGSLRITGKKDPSDYINHSFFPNCFYVFGMVFADRYIEAGEELTIDYGYLLNENEFNVVTGYSDEFSIGRQAAWLKKHFGIMRLA